MKQRPVLYLDLDDTLVSWADGSARPAHGAHEFIVWALARFEVRWLTTWCPSGVMPEDLLADLSSMLGVAPEGLRGIRGLEWGETGSKLNGLAWLEHLVLDRPFVWVEDDYGFGERERRVLESHGLLDRYFQCNASIDTGALTRVHDALARWIEACRAMPSDR